MGRVQRRIQMFTVVSPARKNAKDAARAIGPPPANTAVECRAWRQNLHCICRGRLSIYILRMCIYTDRIPEYILTSVRAGSQAHHLIRLQQGGSRGRSGEPLVPRVVTAAGPSSGLDPMRYRRGSSRRGE